MSPSTVEVRDLYGVAPEEFVARRNELARRLRADGRREEAQRVGKLRRPSVAAAVVNRLVRASSRDLGKLLEAGDNLRQAQEDLIDGRGDATKLRRAVEAEREAVERLLAGARDLPDLQPSPNTLDQVAETLHAAALEDEAREQVVDGCLTHELRHVGLGGLEGPLPAEAPEPPPKRDRDRDRQLKRAEAEARRRAERAARDLQAAQARRDQAAERLAEAEDAVAQAQAQAEQAGRDHDQAARAVQAAED